MDVRRTCGRSDEQDTSATTAAAAAAAAGTATGDNGDVADATLLHGHRRHLEGYLSVDCEKPLNLETNKTSVRSPQTPLSDRHSTPTHATGLDHITLITSKQRHHLNKMAPVFHSLSAVSMCTIFEILIPHVNRTCTEKVLIQIFVGRTHGQGSITQPIAPSIEVCNLRDCK